MPGVPAEAVDQPGPVPSRLLRGAAVLNDPVVRELLDARLVAVLATPETDGGIHAVPVWYGFAGEGIVVATGSRSRKVANVRRAGTATIALHDSRPGFEVVGASIACRARIVDGADAEPFVELVHRRYVTAVGEALPGVSEFMQSDDVAIVLEPVSAFTWDERGSEAAEALRAHGGALPLEPTAPRAL